VQGIHVLLYRYFPAYNTLLMVWDMYHVWCRFFTSRTATAILRKYRWLCRSHHVPHYTAHLRFVLVRCSIAPPTPSTILFAPCLT